MLHQRYTLQRMSGKGTRVGEKRNRQKSDNVIGKRCLERREKSSYPLWGKPIEASQFKETAVGGQRDERMAAQVEEESDMSSGP
ncbi:unnamed protein product [Thelazia callipaeda]|uniref:Uncharacterized protein n=1 Tax=Thelazia callipaeda TaxID=103827 RepID=A0A0N5D0X3_THECL|nr:unnamed protein product [Thelazia callipaeda]